jgi:hypothetical protein
MLFVCLNNEHFFLLYFYDNNIYNLRGNGKLRKKLILKLLRTTLVLEKQCQMVDNICSMPSE